MASTEIIPLPLGLFSVPGREIAKYPGVVVRAPYVVCAYLVRAPGTTLLFDTGIVGDQEGTVLLAGQAFDSASELASAVLAKQLGADVLDCTAPDWVDELLDLDIDVALSAHDLAQWRPPAASFAGSRVRDVWPA